MSVDGPPASGSLPHVPEAPSLVGEILDGRYRIVRKLGEGGMGEVYAAEHVHIEKRFAIKLLRPEIVSNQEATSRFRQEARSSSSIGHRNIIAIEDFGQLSDGRIYMCMELLNGAALNDLITTPQPPERLLNILIQTGHGLAAAHAKNIVHRDMKPENIFVTITPSGEDIPKILDFGIAKVAGNDGQNNLTRTGTIFGTPFYMAPEQALGNPVDARTDIYAMGVIMYEVFAGSLPFQGESFMGILTQHITTEPEPVAQRAAKANRPMPPGLADIIMRCLRKDPAQRFSTMDELVNALIAIYRGVAGAGMSTYMEAFPIASGAHPVPSAPMTAQHMAHAAAAGHPPGPPMHTPPAGTSAVAPSASASGVYPGASSSVVVPPKKGNTGLIIAILAILAVGGVIAAIVISSSKDDKGGGGTGSGSQIASTVGSGSTTPTNGGGSDTTTTNTGIGSGSETTNNNVGSGDAGADAGTGDGSGSAVAAVVDAGVAEPPPVDAPPAAEMVNILITANVAAFEVWDGDTKLFDGPDNLDLEKGQKRELILKAKGYKDTPVTVSSDKTKPKFTLKKLPAQNTNTSNTTNTNTKPPDDNKPKCTGTRADLQVPTCRSQLCKTTKDPGIQAICAMD